MYSVFAWQTGKIYSMQYILWYYTLRRFITSRVQLNQSHAFPERGLLFVVVSYYKDKLPKSIISQYKINKNTIQYYTIFNHKLYRVYKYTLIQRVVDVSKPAASSINWFTVWLLIIIIEMWSSRHTTSHLAVYSCTLVTVLLLHLLLKCSHLLG